MHSLVYILKMNLGFPSEKEKKKPFAEMVSGEENILPSFEDGRITYVLIFVAEEDVWLAGFFKLKCKTCFGMLDLNLCKLLLYLAVHLNGSYLNF